MVTDYNGEGEFRGLKVFHEEKKAVTGGMKLPPEIEAIVTEVTGKLVKADQLLAKVSIHDATNTPVADPSLQETVDHHIAKAEDYLASSYDELANGRPDKAIKSLEQCWHHAQIAIIAAQSQIG